jgi:hypothetical protein
MYVMIARPYDSNVCIYATASIYLSTERDMQSIYAGGSTYRERSGPSISRHAQREKQYAASVM